MPFNLTSSGHIHGCGKPDCWNFTVGMIWDSFSLKKKISLQNNKKVPFSVAKFHWEIWSYF